MKSIDLWDSFGGLDPDLIERSEAPARVIRWKPIAASLAACAAIAILAGSFGPRGAGSASPKEADLAFAYNAAEFSDARAEDTEAPECAGPVPTAAAATDCLVFNDASLMGWDMDAGPAPEPYIRRDLEGAELEAIFPGAVRGYALYEADGTLVSLRADIASPFLEDELHLDLMPEAFGPCPDAEPSSINGLTCWAAALPIRGPGGTATAFEVRFDRDGTGFSLRYKAAPGETDTADEIIRQTLWTLSTTPTPDLSRY